MGGATLSLWVEGVAFEFTMIRADADWEGAKVRFVFTEKDETTELRFYHRGWFCWACYTLAGCGAMASRGRWSRTGSAGSVEWGPADGL